MVKLFFLFLIGLIIWFFGFSDTGQEILFDSQKTSDLTQEIPEQLEAQKLELYRQKEDLEQKIERLSNELEEKRDDGLERIEQVESSLEEAQESYEDIIRSLHRFQRALDISKPLNEQSIEE
jgi:hypothetical protein